jgi:hypothetical protein
MVDVRVRFSAHHPGIPLNIGRLILHESLIGRDRGLDAALRHTRYGMLFEGELEFDNKIYHLDYWGVSRP